MYSAFGRLVKDFPVEKGASKLDIDLSHLNRGIYLLNLKSDDSSATKKLVID
ncbi:T9SS type A sorting domain-containing protein [Wocania arenilitoris]|uniref:T9SS type A sorting domain-containing protein n=1 Tax=Wocania arenilitoris TaxID=2044858 RepID=UPI0034E1D4F6